jgi:uncharacterized protein (DUF362 family)
MRFKPAYVNFHREEYLQYLAERRSKDYAPLVRRDVCGKMSLRHRRPNPYMQDGKALVSFVVSQGDIKADVLRAVEAIGGFDRVLRKDDRILLKPNYNSDDPPPGSTDLGFLGAVIDLLRDHGYDRLWVGESAGRPWVPTHRVFERVGLRAHMAAMQVPLVDFDTCEYADVLIDGDYLDEIAYPKQLEEFDKIIYLPTMKTHFLAGFSMSLKLGVGLTHLCDRAILHGDNNMFVSQRAVEMGIPIQPDLIIMDGRVAFVSGGPAIGLAVHPGIILASGDAVAIDVQGVRCLQNYPAVNHLTGEAWHLPQIKTAVKHGLGIQRDEDLLLVR